jgi:hypothetical protein
MVSSRLGSRSNSQRWQIGFLALLAAVVLTSQIPSAVARGPIARAAEHKHVKPIALAIQYLAGTKGRNGTEFTEAAYAASQGACCPPGPFTDYTFCDLKLGFGYGLRYGHPSAQDPNYYVFNEILGNWHVTKATVKKGKLRTATIAYTIGFFQSRVENIFGPPTVKPPPPGDPQPPSTGSYALTAHGPGTASRPGTATIDGSEHKRIPNIIKCTKE